MLLAARPEQSDVIRLDMKIQCPACDNIVPVENISLDAGWGKCASCQDVFQLTSVLPGYAVPSATPSATPERPFNARAHLERDASALLIHIPAHGMRAGTWGLLGFATFWTAFVAFWTAGAGGFFFNAGPPQPVNLLFAAFSIPFWCVGIGMFGAVLWSARCIKTIRINADEAVMHTRCSYWSRTRRIATEDVQTARVYTPKVTNEQQPMEWGVEVVYRNGSFVLPADTPPEQQWLIAEINDFLQSVKRP